MMKRNKVELIGLAALSLGLVIAGVKNSEFNVAVAFDYSNTTPEVYYRDIDSSLYGEDLLEFLQDLNDKKLRTHIYYDNLMNYFKQTDPGSSSNQVTAFYSGTSSSTSACNKEHVWPNSHGGNLVENDIHMVRPTLKSDNEGRGNSFYVEGLNTEYDGWDPANCGNATYRGDAARIIFYCVVAEPKFKLLDVNKHHTTSDNNDNKMGKLSDLLKWNLQYPVKSREVTRNEAAERLQGNRNPFIDHPEYACKIWGNYNDATKAICGYDKPTSIELSNTSLTVEVSRQLRLSYIIKPMEVEESVEVIWESSNPEVASVTTYGGLITTIKPGTTTITAKIKDFDVSATCTLTVVESSKGGSGCGGNIYTASITLSTISLIGISLLLIKKKGVKHEE